MNYQFHIIKLHNRIDGNLNNEIKVIRAFMEFSPSVTLSCFLAENHVSIDVVKLYEYDYYLVIKYELEENYNLNKADTLFAGFVRIQKLLADYHYQAILISEAVKKGEFNITWVRQQFYNQRFYLKSIS